LVDVATEGQAWMMPGGTSIARSYRLTFARLAERIVGAGLLTEGEMEPYLALHDDTAFVSVINVPMAARGRRPEACPEPDGVGRRLLGRRRSRRGRGGDRASSQTVPPSSRTWWRTRAPVEALA